MQQISLFQEISRITGKTSNQDSKQGQFLLKAMLTPTVYKQSSRPPVQEKKPQVYDSRVKLQNDQIRQAYDNKRKERFLQIQKYSDLYLGNAQFDKKFRQTASKVLNKNIEMAQVGQKLNQIKDLSIEKEVISKQQKQRRTIQEYKIREERAGLKVGPKQPRSSKFNNLVYKIYNYD